MRITVPDIWWMLYISHDCCCFHYWPEVSSGSPWEGESTGRWHLPQPPVLRLNDLWNAANLIQSDWGRGEATYWPQVALPWAPKRSHLLLLGHFGLFQVPRALQPRTPEEKTKGIMHVKLVVQNQMQSKCWSVTTVSADIKLCTYPYKQP